MNEVWAINPADNFLKHVEPYSCYGKVSVFAERGETFSLSDKEFAAYYRDNAREVIRRLEALMLLPRRAIDAMLKRGDSTGLLKKMMRDGIISTVSWTREGGYGGAAYGRAYRLTDSFLSAKGKNTALHFKDSDAQRERYFLSLLPLSHFGSTCMDCGYQAVLHTDDVRPYLVVWQERKRPLVAASIRIGDKPFAAFGELLKDRPDLAGKKGFSFNEKIVRLLEQVTGSKTHANYLMIAESFRHMEFCAREVLSACKLSEVPKLYYGFDSLTCLDEPHASYGIRLGTNGDLVLKPARLAQAERRPRRGR